MPSTAKQARRYGLLADIGRRDWLLRMLALGTAACGRRAGDPAHARGSTVVIAVSDPSVLQHDAWG